MTIKIQQTFQKTLLAPFSGINILPYLWKMELIRFVEPLVTLYH